MSMYFSMQKDIVPLLKLSIPLALTGLVQSGVWFFETLFLAHLSTEALAAGSLVGWLFGTLVVIVFGVLSAINILVAYKRGEHDEKGIALVARDGVLLAILFSLPAILLFWNMAPIFLLFGQSQAVVLLSSAYLHALCWGILADFVTLACLEVIIGLGDVRVVLLFSVLAVILNILFSYLFIFGKFGFKAQGIAGAGWGMTVSYWLTALVFAGFIIINKHYRHYFRYVFTFFKPLFLWELLQIGLPMGVMYCFEVAFFLALALCIGIVSSDMQAANQVALQYLGLVMAAMFSIAQAVTVRIGHLLGGRDVRSAEKAGQLGVGFALIVTSSVAIFYWVFPMPLIAIDFDVNNPTNLSLVNDIKQLLAVCAIFQILEATRVTLFGALRGLKDTKFTLVLSIMSFWFIALPLGYLLAIRFQWGGVGFWWGMVIGVTFSVILQTWRWKKKIKRQYARKSC